MNPFFYSISVKKEVVKRHLKDFISKTKFTKSKSSEKLPVLLYQTSSILIKKGKGIDINLQKNKAVNLNIASKRINETIINPGETFSFWKTIGKPSVSNGYKKGRVLINNKLIPGVGGGLCNLGNMVHLLALHSPLDVTERHYHSDALAPEKDHHILSSGTSVDYNYIDFRCKNNTSQKFQFILWCDEEKLYAQIRCESEPSVSYELSEEDRHFSMIDGKYYCFSKIYKNTVDKRTSEILSKALIRDNKSEVMYDYGDIQKELIR